MPEILTDAYLLFTFVFKQALNVAPIPKCLKWNLNASKKRIATQN